MAKKKKGKGEVISVDFTGVKGSNRVPEGEYKVKVVAITMEESEKSEQPYLKWELEITEGKHKGKKLYHITSLQPQALFNLRNTLEALGVEVEEKAMKLNLNDYIGLEMGVVVEIETYQGNARSRVVDVFNLDEIEDEDEEDEDSEDTEDDDDDDVDNSDEDEEDEDEDDELTEEDLKYLESLNDEELIETAKEHGVEIIYSNKKKKKLDRKAMIEAIIEAASDDDDDDSEEEDDEDEELTEEDLKAMDDYELIEKAREVGADIVKKKKKLDRKATIKNILEVLED